MIIFTPHNLLEAPASSLQEEQQNFLRLVQEQEHKMHDFKTQAERSTNLANMQLTQEKNQLSLQLEEQKKIQQDMLEIKRNEQKQEEQKSQNREREKAMQEILELRRELERENQRNRD